MFNTSIFDNAASSSADATGQDFLSVPQPIDITHQRHPSIFNNLRFRRELIAHSQGMGGVSWGSVTIGLWLKDEVMMYSNQNNNHQNQHNLINPRRGLFRLGGGGGAQSNVNVQNPHPMAMSPPNTTLYLPNLEADYCKDYSCCGQLLPTLHDLLRHYEEAHISASPPQDNANHLVTASHRARNNLNNIHNVMDTVSTTDVFLNNHHSSHAPGPHGSLHLPASHFNLQHQAAASGGPLHSSGTMSPTLTMTGHPDSPGHAPTGSMQHTHSSSLLGGTHPLNIHTAQPRSIDQSMVDESDAMYIDDPARHLYVMENEEYKPFKCPVIGCDKNYKNQNGLKYHRLHGHQNQTLKENEDGTFSIIDPESNTPYLDGAGMEKDKPYRCEVCGRRYKNLNGLKYHRGHTTH